MRKCGGNFQPCDAARGHRHENPWHGMTEAVLRSIEPALPVVCNDDSLDVAKEPESSRLIGNGEERSARAIAKLHRDPVGFKTDASEFTQADVPHHLELGDSCKNEGVCGEERLEVVTVAVSAEGQVRNVVLVLVLAAAVEALEPVLAYSVAFVVGLLRWPRNQRPDTDRHTCFFKRVCQLTRKILSCGITLGKRTLSSALWSNTVVVLRIPRERGVPTYRVIRKERSTKEVP